jgi:hypothetical protein
MTYQPFEEIFRQQRDGARCGCHVCASAITMHPGANSHEPMQRVAHIGLPTPDAGRSDTHAPEQH